MKLHLPQFRWPFRSTADRYAKDYLAEERSGSGKGKLEPKDRKSPWQRWDGNQWVTMPRLWELEQRVSALEETVEELGFCTSNQSGINQSCLKSRRDLRARIRKLEGKPPLASDSSPVTPSPATESPTTGSLSDATDTESTRVTILASSPLDQPIMSAGPAGHDSGSAEQVDAST